MRQRILPEIGRWQKQNLRLAIYGIGTYTQVLLGTLPMLMPLVQCFIDRRASGVYLGRPCIQPEAVHPSDIDVIIYSSKSWEAEMYRNLGHLTSIEHVLIYGTLPANLKNTHSVPAQNIRSLSEDIEALHPGGQDQSRRNRKRI